MSLTSNSLECLYKKLDIRNLELGFARYDPSDLNAQHIYRLAYQCGYLGQLAAKLLKIPELVVPQVWRKILHCKKTRIPTAYYHIGMSYIDQLIRKKGKNKKCLLSLENILIKAIQQAIPQCKNLVWGHSYPYLGVERAIQDCSTACGHHCARLAYLLHRVSNELPLLGDKTKQWARSSSIGLLNDFNWHQHATGWTASYFTTTHDEVINIMAEYAMVLASVLQQKLLGQGELKAKEKLHGLIATIIAEQSKEGAWDYYTKQYAVRIGANSIVDNHHSAMVVTALVRILRTNQLDFQAAETVCAAINKGLSFFMRHLLTEQGIALYFPNSHKKADIAGYCESVIMLSESSINSFVSPELRERAQKMASFVLKKAIQSFLLPSGDVASSRPFSRKVNLQSIRWGSGLLMEAISRYLLVLENYPCSL